jgi:hypothetical protein
LSGFRLPKTRAEGEGETDLPRHGGRQPCGQPTGSEGEQLRGWPASSLSIDPTGGRDEVTSAPSDQRQTLLARAISIRWSHLSLSLSLHRIQTRQSDQSCSHKLQSAMCAPPHQKTPAPLPLRNSLASSRLTHSLTLRAHLTIAAGGNNGDVLTYNSKSFVIFWWKRTRASVCGGFLLFARERERLTQPRTASCDVRRYWTEAPPPPPSLPPTVAALVRGCRAAWRR